MNAAQRGALFLIIIVGVISDAVGNHLNAGFYNGGIARHDYLMAEIGVVPAGTGEDIVILGTSPNINSFRPGLDLKNLLERNSIRFAGHSTF